MTTINFSLLKAVAVAAGKEVTRYYLEGVQFTIGQNGVVMVATDGHRMIAARQNTAPAQDPCAAIIPLGFLDKIKPVRNADTAEIMIEDSDITIIYAGATYKTKALDATYPDWRRIVPTDANGQAAQFNPVYLNEFAKAMKLAGTGGKSPLPIVNHNGENAALVDLGAIDNVDWFGVIMPIANKTGRGLPVVSWAK